MKSFSILFSLFLTFTACAEDITVGLPQDSTDHGTIVTVSPLKEAPKHLPKTVNKEQPKWWKITLLGIGLAPVEFFISASLHEASHAAVAKLFGAEITAFSPYPHQHEGRPFVFADFHMKGSLTPGEQALVTAAPMFLDTAILGTYGSLVQTNNLPSNKYAQMAIWVFAAGHWVDLATHINARTEYTDTRKLESYFQKEHGLSITQSTLAVRGSQAVVLAAGGYFLYKGFKQLYFEKNSDESLTLSAKKQKSIINRHDLYLAPNGGADGGGPGLILGGTF